jgi:hypothetical protein
VFGSRKGFKKFDVTRMPKGFQNIDLVLKLFLQAFFSYLVSVRGFDRDEFSCQAMQPEVNFAKSAFSEHSADFVEFYASLGHFVVLLKAVRNYSG